jgi:hypothetical protein
MRLKLIFPGVLMATFSAVVVHADSTAFGIASAYNFVAHSGKISDPYLSLASTSGGPYAAVTQAGTTTTNYFNIDAAGNAYASSSNAAGFNFANENYAASPYTGSSPATGSTSPINGIAASIGQAGEVHYGVVDGTLQGTPRSSAPEPATLFLLGTGLLSIAGIVNRRQKSSSETARVLTNASSAHHSAGAVATDGI